MRLEILTSEGSELVVDKPIPYDEDHAVYILTSHYGAILSKSQAETLLATLQSLLAGPIPPAKIRPKRRKKARKRTLEISVEEKEQNKLTPCSGRANLFLVGGSKGQPPQNKEDGDDERDADDENG